MAQVRSTYADSLVEGPVAAGSAILGNPLQMGGSDGANIRYLATDANGNLKIVPTPSSSAGASTAKVLSASGTNATSTKGSAGVVYSFNFFNAAAANRYVHFYDKATLPVVGTDTPKYTVGVPAGGTAQWTGVNGETFSNGIGYGISTGAADSDTGTVATNDVTGHFEYV